MKIKDIGKTDMLLELRTELGPFDARKSFEEKRFEAAKSAMSGMCASDRDMNFVSKNGETVVQIYARISIEMADELLKQLGEK